MRREEWIASAKEVAAERYPEAAATFAAGSWTQGWETRHSDLDLVVVFEHVERAVRDSFRWRDLPVEVFIHDPETLSYFCWEIDRKAGVPALASMVRDGIEVPAASELSSSLKKLAMEAIDAGPPPLSDEEMETLRYSISDQVDDLRDPRSNQEMVATAGALYGALANFHFRAHGLWSAKGKAIPRRLREEDSKLCAEFCGAFDELFRAGDPRSVIDLAAETLRPFGGALFEGYRREAPASWRKRRK